MPTRFAERGRRYLTIEQILAWADAHFRRTGQWPTHNSGPIVDAPGETWAGVNLALECGGRGLEEASSLVQLLAETGRRPNRGGLPNLSKEQIVAWAEAHFRRHGQWPHRQSGQVADAPQETWQSIDGALQVGRRGLSGRTTLARLLLRHRYLLLQTTYVPIRALWARIGTVAHTDACGSRTIK